MTQFRLGKKPPRIDKRTLKFRDYVTPALPAPPPSVDWTAKVPTWPMMGNDQYGDCTCAAAGHLIETWTANATTPLILPDDEILAAYNVVDGGVDQGADLLTVLNYWRQTGIGGDTIVAYAQVGMTNVAEIQQAIDLFGGIYIGVALPDFAVQGDMLTVPWMLPTDGSNDPPDPNNGHCIPLVQYDAQGVTAITWGEAKRASWDFITTYADEGYAILSDDWIEVTGESPGGLNIAQLQADLQAVTA
jgi:hypothetical protein